jgi:hypothetical protein
LKIARDHKQVGRVARQTIDGRDQHHVAMRHGGEHLFSSGRSAVAPLIFSENALGSGGPQLDHLAGEVLGVHDALVMLSYDGG